MLIERITLQQQVEAFIREKVESGEFAGGSKLPSIQSLSKMTGTSVCTVNLAVKHLIEEGLLERESRRAAYVRIGANKLTCAGIYLGDTFSIPEAEIFRVLSRSISQKLAKIDVSTQIWTDDRSPQAQGEIPESLRQAIERGSVQALISPHMLHESVEWFEKLNIPTALFTTETHLKTAHKSDRIIDYTISSGVEELKKQGCRTVGIITHLMLTEGAKDREYAISLYNRFLDELGKHGMETCKEWLGIPDREPVSMRQNGYEAFHKIWNRKERPDGLLVFPDYEAQGVVTAILERRVRVPEELKLVLHGNDLLPYPCPLSATLIEVEVERIADNLIAIIQAQLKGEDIPQFPVPAHVVHRTGGSWDR